MSLTKVSYSMISGALANVLDYGADPTGSSDSTSQIQAAIASGKSVYLPKGTYKITSAIDLTAGDISFIGENKALVSIIQYTSNTPVLKIGGFNLYVSDLTLTYSTEQVKTADSANCLEIYALAWSSIDRLILSNGCRGMYIAQVAVYLGANFLFSCTVSDILIQQYTKNALHLLSFNGGNTGSVFTNIDCIGRNSSGVANVTDEAVYLGGFTEGVFNQLNIESTKPTQAIFLNSNDSLVFNGLHFELCNPQLDFGGFIDCAGGRIVFKAVTILNCNVSVANYQIVFRISTPSVISVEAFTQKDGTITTPIFALFGFPAVETDSSAELISSSYSGITTLGFSSSVPSKIIRNNSLVNNVQFQQGAVIYNGSGTPEGVITAPIGSLFLRTDGSTSTTLYVKTSGTGNTGWTAK